MLSHHPYLRRCVFPILLTVLILVGVTACSDDDPTRPPATSDISGVVRTVAGGAEAGATVFLGRVPDFPPMTATMVVDSVLTDELGRYEFDGLAAGHYRVYGGVWDTQGEGFARVSPFSGTLDIAAKSAGHTVNLTLQEMAADGVVAGEAVYFEELGLAPADSAAVSLFCYEGAATVVAAEIETDIGGQYSLPGVRTGNYVVSIVKILETEGPFDMYLTAESESFFCDGEDLFRVERLVLEDIFVEKPAIYVYPEQPTRFQVELEFGPQVRLTASEPEYGTGWDVIVDETGRIDETWDYLFYEIAMPGAPLIPEGWCLSWSELASGLESLADSLGLNAVERNDFLGYWIPRLPRRDYYEIFPVYGSDLDSWVQLDVTPAPDSVLRFWLFLRGRETASELAAPPIPMFERTGTTLVEWGGAIIP